MESIVKLATREEIKKNHGVDKFYPVLGCPKCIGAPPNIVFTEKPVWVECLHCHSFFQVSSTR